MKNIILYCAFGLRLVSFHYLFDNDPEVSCRWYWVMPGTENKQPPFNKAGCWRWCDTNGDSQMQPDEVVKVPDQDCCTYANICF